MADNEGECNMEPNSVQQVSNEIDARVGATDVGMLKAVQSVPPQKDGTSGTNRTKCKSDIKPKEDETLF